MTDDHAHHDPLGGRIGMWVFLFSEALLFGTLFIVYAVDLNLYRTAFSTCSRDLDKLLGAGNTIILLTSSLTMALAIVALGAGRRRRCLGFLSATAFLGAAFLAVKALEWGHKIAHEVYPQAEAMLRRPAGEQTFYGLYYIMTGLHALHVAVGIVAIVVVATMAIRGRVSADRPGLVQNVGLYWHLVDVVWIFLFPLFYLVR